MNGQVILYLVAYFDFYQIFKRFITYIKKYRNFNGFCQLKLLIYNIFGLNNNI